LQDVNTSILPRADNAYDLGSSDKRWRDLYVAGFGDLGSLRIGGVEVIDSNRNLKNVNIPPPITSSPLVDVGISTSVVVPPGKYYVSSTPFIEVVEGGEIRVEGALAVA